MNRRRKYFNILGIDPTTDLSKIKRAYRKKALVYHPDRNAAPDAEARFIEINEAYEFLSGQTPNVQAEPIVRTAEEIRQEKIKRARERFKDLKSREEQKEAEYFAEITSGIKWRLFRIAAICTMVLGIMLVTDFIVDRSSYMVENPPVFNLVQREIGVEDERFHVDNNQYWLTKFRPIKVNQSFFFKDIKSISLLLSSPMKSDPLDPGTRNAQFQLYDFYPQIEIYAHGSVYALFPFPHIFLFIPFLLIFFKRQNFRFSLWRIISIWAIFPFAFVLIFWEGRLFYLLGIF